MLSAAKCSKFFKTTKKKKKNPTKCVYKSSHCVTLSICCSVLQLTPTLFVFLLTSFLLKFEEQAYCICTSLCVVFLGGWFWSLGEGCWVFWREEEGTSVTVAKAEKSFLLKCEFIISTNFCFWVNLERDKVRVIIIQLPSFMLLDAYEVSFEKHLIWRFQAWLNFPNSFWNSYS